MSNFQVNPNWRENEVPKERRVINTKLNTPFEDWKTIVLVILAEMKLKNIPTPLAMKHAWEFGQSDESYTTQLQQTEKRKDARRGSKPAGRSVSSGGVDLS